MPELSDGTPEMLRPQAEAFLRSGVASVVPRLRPLAELDLAAAARLTPLPYHDAGFSARVLRQQLDQSTDQSSRRLPVIARQVNWLARQLPAGSLERVFHPLCGPGLVALALRAHGVESYVGVDIGPAIIAFARRVTGGTAAFTFEAGDVERYHPGPQQYSACLLTYEGLNAFPPLRARALLASMAGALRPGGWLAMDVRGEGNAIAPGPGRRCSWHAGGSVFAAGPHLLLDESARLGWPGTVSGHRFLILREEPGVPATVFHSLVWHYPAATLGRLLDSAGFDLVAAHQPFVFDSDVPEAAAPVIVLARRRRG
ncbi:MAG: class I SAM-dependent methyltransferase [Acidimicrobiia bacterium]